MSERTVVIVQRRLTHYRIELFERMRQELISKNIRLRLLVGRATTEEIIKQDTGFLEWAEELPTYYFGKICWQPCSKEIKKTDLVIITQENKLVYNFLLMSIFRPRRLAFWGHGRNMQSRRQNSISERLKKWLTLRVDWWFAYTSLSRDIVASAGFKEERITVLDNAVDVRALVERVAAVSSSDKLKIATQLGLKQGSVGVFIGSLYKDKRLNFLIEAAKIIKTRIPDFSLLIVGDGPERGTVEIMAQDKPWIFLMGPCFADEKAKILSVADVLLNPGLVGLGILDAFAAALPMVTTDCGLHSPEISYLRSGQNGLMTANSVVEFAEAVINILLSPNLQERLALGAKADAELYTVENMALKFCDGVVRCLNTHSA